MASNGYADPLVSANCAICEPPEWAASIRHLMIPSDQRQVRHPLFTSRSTAALTKRMSGSASEARWSGKLRGPLAVECSIVVEDAVENCGLYRVFVSLLF